MASVSAFPSTARPWQPRRAGRASGIARRSLATVAAVARAAFLASSDSSLDEAGVLRTAVAQQRRELARGA